MKSKLLGNFLAKSIILFGMLTSTDAMSALTNLAETKEGLIYINQNSIEKTASTVRVSITQDFHEMQTLGTHEYLSSRSWYEIDCTGKKLRQIRIEIFPQNMAMGGLLQEDSKNQNWTTPEQGKLQSLICTALCGKS
jgi:hypothetical protein